MDEKLKESIKEPMSKLPKTNQQAINSIDWLKKCQEIGNKHLLADGEIAELKTEVALVLVGLSDMDTLRSFIDNDIGGTGWQEIEEEVIKNILQPIAELIEKQ